MKALLQHCLHPATLLSSEMHGHNSERTPRPVRAAVCPDTSSIISIVSQMGSVARTSYLSFVEVQQFGPP
ncbi:hypothetical protein AG1IA_04953 [Rhizoctonia solani AG-1 IA]|uniref:Uncharacterized protein n=1 Tax=Thanatephorus cucumeris (strain AG1-IA) TaxID=983506 RepID=L8WXD6_THACA|nr:hypothetical protein AG1IA_04953 [Rhizoctonia solani AG-1 IA]